MTKFIIGVLVLLAIIVDPRGQPIALLQSGNMPMIYYYSREQEAFITEFADGSESQILAQHSLEEPNGDISGAGWSPDGQYFVWYDVDSYKTGSTDLYVLDRTTSETAIFDMSGRVRRSIWSPDAKYLGVLVDKNTEEDHFWEILLFDPQTDAFQSIIQADFDSNVQGMVWTSDGRYLVQQIASTITIVEAGTGIEFVIDGQFPRSFFYRNMLAPSTNLIYQKDDGQVVVRHAIEQVNETALGVFDEEISFVDWSHDRRYAILYIRTVRHNVFEAWLLDAESGTLSVISDEAVSNNVQPFGVIDQGTSWSPTSNFAWLFLAIKDSDYPSLAIFEPETYSLSVISHNIITLFFPNSVQWLANGDELAYLRLRDDTADNVNTIFRHDVGSNATTFFEEGIDLGAVQFTLSPNNRYVLFFTGCVSPREIVAADAEFCIYDTELGEFHAAPPSDQEGFWVGYVGGQGGFVEWHFGSEWLLICEVPIFSDCNPLRIANADFSVVRDLGISARAPANFGWLPAMSDTVEPLAN